MNKRKPIETAPRDGSLIVGVAGNGTFLWPMRWRDGRWRARDDEGIEFNFYPDQWEPAEEAQAAGAGMN